MCCRIVQKEFELCFSSFDFVVYGCDNLMQLEDDLQQIETLRKIDIFDFDSIKNEYLLEDIKKYGKQIY